MDSRSAWDDLQSLIPSLTRHGSESTWKPSDHQFFLFLLNFNTRGQILEVQGTSLVFAKPSLREKEINPGSGENESVLLLRFSFVARV